jgi:hypothetical protein
MGIGDPVNARHQAGSSPLICESMAANLEVWLDSMDLKPTGGLNGA